MLIDNLPAPDDPRPRLSSLELTIESRLISVIDDHYSDRIRCNHPDPEVDGVSLGRALAEVADRRGRGRVVVLAPTRLTSGLLDAGLGHEATIPGFYRGEENCDVLGLALDRERLQLADAEAVKKVERLIHDPPAGRSHAPVTTYRATTDDAVLIAALIAETFEHYPTPSGVPSYIKKQLQEGIPFRIVREEGRVVACASADLVRDARTAELTDCATRPDCRGRGLMQMILADLMDDLRQMSYPTAFTLARAREPGMNLAFLRLGFDLHGLMRQSCRIGSGMEDIHVWSRFL